MSQNKISQVSEEKIEKIRNRTAFSLPDNPSAKGWNASDIRAALYQGITEGEDSVLGELNRVVSGVNKALEEIINNVSANVGDISENSTKLCRLDERVSETEKKVSGSATSLEVVSDTNDHKYTFILRDSEKRELSNFVLDLPVESLITDIEDGFDDAGKPALIITLQSGVTRTISLSDIFVGVVNKSAAPNIVYATDGNGDTVNLPTDTTTGSVVRRDDEGKILDSRGTAYPTDVDLADVRSELSAGINNNIDSIDEHTEYITNLEKRADITEKRIEQLESAALAYTEDSSIAHSKLVPVNSAKYALVNKIGGMTYKPYNENNIVPYPYVDSQIPSVVGQTNVSNGISITLNDDRSITLNGTGNLDLSFIYDTLSITKSLAVSFGTTLPQGVECVYNESIGYNEELGYEEWQEYRLDMSNGEAVVSVYSRLEAVRLVGYNITFNNVTIYPMIADSYTVLSFFEELKSTEVTGLRSVGANLFKFPYRQGSRTEYGVTITVNDNGSITFKGSNTGQHYSDLKLNYKTYKLPLGTYTFSGNFPSNMWMEFYTRNENDVNIEQTGRITGSRTFAITKEYSYIDCYIRAALNATVDVTIYPMLNYGTEAAPYKPYRSEAVDTFQISEELRAFLEPYGYGLGVNSEFYNYIDFERKVFVQNVARKVFTGDEDIGAGAHLDNDVIRYYLDLPEELASPSNTTAVQVVCNHYPPSSNTKTWNLIENGLSANINAIRWVDTELLRFNGGDGIEQKEAMYAKLKAWYDADDPLTVDYILANPKEIDISKWLSDTFNRIEVEGGGLIIAENDYKYAAPTTLSFVERKEL